MKIYAAFAAALIAAICLASCSASPPNLNHQQSSRTDAEIVVSRIPDFDKFVQYFSVASASHNSQSQNLSLPVVRESFPQMNGYVGFAHEIIYRTRIGTMKVVLLSDELPPKVISTLELR